MRPRPREKGSPHPGAAILVGILIAGLFLLGPVACGGDDPTGPAGAEFEDDFELLWEDFDRTYPFFALKGIDWDSVRTQAEPAVRAATTGRAFFDLLADLLLGLEDPHVRLTGPFGTVSYRGWFEPFPHNFDFQVVADGHLTEGPEQAPNGTMRYGRIDAEIGYVHIPSWGGDGHAEDIEAVLAALPDVRALIVDTRDNGGGSDLNARRVAGRFADRRRLFRRIRFRGGPEPDDFTEPEDDFLDPAGTRFEGPAALLTNRRVISSAEAFVLAMRVLPSVVVVGDTTGGGSANPALRTLPIGWSYSVSRWLVTTPEDEPFEGVGLAPDLPVWICEADRARGRDTIVDSAVAVLRGALEPVASAKTRR